MNIFRFLTPLTYWLLIGMWTYILIFLLLRLRLRKFESNLINMLVIILAIDAFRTLLESIYFGAWYTSLSGFIPIGIHDFLIRSEMVIIPKIMNVIAAVLIIIILFKRWFPAEKLDRKMLENSIKEHTEKMEENNKKLKAEIVERKHAEENLKRSERQYYALSENNPDYLMRYDRQLRHIYANQSTLNISGFTEEEYIGKTHKELGYPDDLCRFWGKVIEEVFESGETKIEIFDWENVKDQITLEWRCFPEFAPDGSVESVLAISRDISERKKTEIEVSNKNKELENQFKRSEDQRLATLSVLKDLDSVTKDLKSEIIERQKTEEKLNIRMKELEIFNDAAVDRELKINDMRKEINDLLEKLSEGKKYDIVN